MMRKWWLSLNFMVAIVHCLLSTSEQKRSHRIFPNISRKSGNITRHVDLVNKNAEVFATIINSLEELNILSSSKTLCYTLKKIVREIASPENKMFRKRTIGIYLYFEENLIVDSHAKVITINKEKNTLYNQSKSHPLSIHDDRLSVQSNRTKADCSSTKVLTDGEHSSVSETEVQNSTMINTTVAGAAGIDSSDEQGLSRTQVVVISTCSTVIGTFFLVAGIMRLRNYVKRVQMEHTVNRRAAATGAFRHTGIVQQYKQGGGVSGDSLRQEPLSQKQTKQSVAPKRELHPSLSNGEGKKRKSSFTKPTVLVTTPSTPSLMVSSDDCMDRKEEHHNNDVDGSTDDDAQESSPLLKQVSSDYAPDIKQDPLLFKQIHEAVGTNDIPDDINPHDVDLARRQSFPVDINNLFEKPKFIFPNRRAESTDSKCLPRQYCIDRSMVGDESTLCEVTGSKESLIALKNSESTDPSNDKHSVDYGGSTICSPITSGLCQSDRSLSSLGQPSYNYGYQTEYTDSLGYFQQAYHSGESIIVDICDSSEHDNSKSHSKKLLHNISMTEFVTDKSLKSHLVESFDYPSAQPNRPLTYQHSFDFGGSSDNDDSKLCKYRKSFDFGGGTGVSDKGPIVQNVTHCSQSFDFGTDTRGMEPSMFPQMNSNKSETELKTIHPQCSNRDEYQMSQRETPSFYNPRRGRLRSKRSNPSFGCLSEEEHDTGGSSLHSDACTIVKNTIPGAGCDSKTEASETSDDRISMSSLEQSSCVLPPDSCSIDGASDNTDSCVVSLSDGSYTLSPSSDCTPHMSDIESQCEDLESDDFKPQEGENAHHVMDDVMKIKKSFELNLDRETDSPNHSSSSSQTPTKTKEQLQNLLLSENVKATFV